VLVSLTFFVSGHPRAQGSKSIFRGRLIESSPNLPVWRGQVAEMARRAAEATEWVKVARGNPLALNLRFAIPPGKERGRFLTSAVEARHAIPIDLDKAIRAVCDAITESGSIWDDDGQVSVILAAKYWATTVNDPEPGVTITVEALR
jgi:Holliday junction resolvase RusA-like endonuclease